MSYNLLDSRKNLICICLASKPTSLYFDNLVNKFLNEYNDHQGLYL